MGGKHRLAEGRIQRKRRMKTEDGYLTGAITNRRPETQRNRDTEPLRKEEVGSWGIDKCPRLLWWVQN